MNSKRINIDVVSWVAKALFELKDQMVFVGGAVVSLYADMESDEELRETFDVDLTSISLINYSNYSILLERLAQLGFHPDPEGHSICSLQYQGIAIDIIPPEDGPIGRANRFMEELLSVHLNPNTIDERFPIIIEKVNQIVLM